MVLCLACEKRQAQIKRPLNGEALCHKCFIEVFEREVHQTISNYQLFSRGDRVAIAVSGGKDSTVLAHLLTTLNERHNYGLNLFLLAVDEGIKGYRDDSLESVKRNEEQFKIPLHVVSYQDVYGWSMDAIVASVGFKHNCTFCGVFRRRALDEGVVKLRADVLCTGHNADDAAETILMNILRGDINRIARCSDIITGKEKKLRRCKPLMFAYEKEIVLYAHFLRLDYFSTECVYSKNAYRGVAREFVKKLEASDPQLISAILFSSQQIETRPDLKQTTPGSCRKCGWMSSSDLCKACVLLEGLNSNQAHMALASQSRQRRHRKHMEIAMTL